jgi:hypothetical protein
MRIGQRGGLTEQGLGGTRRVGGLRLSCTLAAPKRVGIGVGVEVERVVGAEAGSHMSVRKW